MFVAADGLVVSGAADVHEPPLAPVLPYLSPDSRAAYLSEDGRAERYWNMPRPRYRAVGRNRLSLRTAA
jgi:hypothetical protein